MPAFRAFERRTTLWLAGIALLGALGLLALYALLQTDVVVWLGRGNRWVADTIIRRMGYWGVFALMFIESSLVPFPSEVVVPPAADLARRLPDWNVGIVVLVGTAGSLAGALFNYGLALWLGRPLLLRMIDGFGHYLRITRTGYDQAERFFQRHGAMATLTGRLIPGIRQIISLPAGLSRMNLLLFCVLTSVGAGGWVAVLAWLGYWFGANAEQLAEHSRRYSLWIVAGVALAVAAYVAVHMRRGRLAAQSD